MDWGAHLWREVRGFEAAARRAVRAEVAPAVPSCPGWSVSDLVAHLGWVHRYVTHLVTNRCVLPPDVAEVPVVGLPADRAGWPVLGRPGADAGAQVPVPVSLVDWFWAGAAGLVSLFADTDPEVEVWTWSRERSVGFWLRMQTIEAAVHRWDAENAVGVPEPVDVELARCAVAHTFEVMVPRRRERAGVPAGAGESFRFRQTDGAGDWVVRFDGVEVALGAGPARCDVELAGTASDLMLFLWGRIPAGRVGVVTGDRAVLDHYFRLVPPE